MNSFKESLICDTNQTITREDLEYYEIAVNRPLDYAQNISHATGPKFKTIEQRERYERLLSIYNNYARQFVYASKLTDKALMEYTIQRILDEQLSLRANKSENKSLDFNEVLSPIDIKILKSHLPKQQEQDERI